MNKKIKELCDINWADGFNCGVFISCITICLTIIVICSIGIIHMNILPYALIPAIIALVILLNSQKINPKLKRLVSRLFNFFVILFIQFKFLFRVFSCKLPINSFFHSISVLAPFGYVFSDNSHTRNFLIKTLS